MADVKFMDLSQNGNPATTDSVLIGNSTDGLKRTTVGAIGNLFSVKGLFHFETVTGQTVVDPESLDPFRSVKIVAPDVFGYKFAFWLSPSTVDSVEPSYIENTIGNTTNIWVVLPYTTSDIYKTKPIKFSVIAVYVKSSVA